MGEQVKGRKNSGTYSLRKSGNVRHEEQGNEQRRVNGAAKAASVERPSYSRLAGWPVGT